MKRHTVLVLSLVALGAAAAAPSFAIEPALAPGLVAVHAGDLDELQLQPSANLAAYHQVLIDPAQIAFRSDWNRNAQDSLGFTRRLSADDVQRIVDDTAANLQQSLAEAFRARGYELATAPGPGVLRLSPRLVDFYVNAPDARPPGSYKSYTKDAGEVTMVLEARDAATGALLARVVDHRRADKTDRLLTRATGVEENYFFDEVFSHFASTCAREFASTTPSRISYVTPH